MADIFVSYASEDREIARALVEVLEAQGWSVWWDRNIAAGTTWDDSIKKGMDEARCMIVLWSGHSVASRMVKDEANFAANKDALVPALIANVEIPYGYGMLQAANLTGWDGDVDHAGLQQVLTATRKRLGRKTTAIKAPAAARVRRMKRIVPALLLVPPALAAILSTRHPASFAIQVRAQVTEVAMRMSKEQALPSAPLPVTELGAAGLTNIELPATRNVSAASITADRVLLKSAPPLAVGGFPVRGPLAAVTAPQAGMLALKPMIVPDSALVRIRADGGSTSILYQGGKTRAARVTVVGRINVIPLLTTVSNFPAGDVVLNGDSTGIELELTTAPVAPLATSLTIRGLDFTRVDRYREEVASDQVVSTIKSAAVTITALHREGPTLADGERLVLDGAEGEITELRIDSSTVRFAFDGKVRSITTAEGPWQPTLLSIVAARYLAVMIAVMAVYIAAAVFIMLSARRRLT